MIIDVKTISESNNYTWFNKNFCGVVCKYRAKVYNLDWSGQVLGVF